MSTDDRLTMALYAAECKVDGCTNKRETCVKHGTEQPKPTPRPGEFSV